MFSNETIFPMKPLLSTGVVLLDCDHRTPKPSLSGYPYVAIPDIQNYRINLSNVRLISKADYESWTKKTKPRTGDVIMTRRGRVGDIAAVPQGLECAIGQDLVILRSDEKQVLQRYLKWALRGPLYEREVQKYLNVGAIFYSLNCGDIPKFEIPVPSIPEQLAISEVLDSLELKIELNQRMNYTLEAMGQALFKRWFVDFEFPNQEGKLYKSTGGKMVDSIFGEIPMGWESGKIADVLDILETGFRPSGGIQETNEGIPSIGAESIERIGIFDFSKTKLVPKEFYQSMSRGKLANYDVLLYKDGGRPGMFKPKITLAGNGFPFSEACINEHVYRIKANERSSQNFLYYWLSTDRLKEEMANRATGVAVPGLNSTEVRNLPILIPDKSVQHSFEKIVAPLTNKILLNALQLKNLTQIRDLLLPKLISGIIRVPINKETWRLLDV